MIPVPPKPPARSLYDPTTWKPKPPRAPSKPMEAFDAASLASEEASGSVCESQPPQPPSSDAPAPPPPGSETSLTPAGLDADESIPPPSLETSLTTAGLEADERSPRRGVVRFAPLDPGDFYEVGCHDTGSDSDDADEQNNHHNAAGPSHATTGNRQYAAGSHHHQYAAGRTQFCSNNCGAHLEPPVGDPSVVAEYIRAKEWHIPKSGQKNAWCKECWNAQFGVARGVFRCCGCDITEVIIADINDREAVRQQLNDLGWWVTKKLVSSWCPACVAQYAS